VKGPDQSVRRLDSAMNCRQQGKVAVIDRAATYGLAPAWILHAAEAEPVANGADEELAIYARNDQCPTSRAAAFWIPCR